MPAITGALTPRRSPGCSRTPAGRRTVSWPSCWHTGAARDSSTERTPACWRRCAPPAALPAGPHGRPRDGAERRAATRGALGGGREAGAAAVRARLRGAEGKTQQPSQPPPPESHRLPDLLAYLESPAGRVGDVERG